MDDRDHVTGAAVVIIEVPPAAPKNLLEERIAELTRINAVRAHLLDVFCVWRLSEWISVLPVCVHDMQALSAGLGRETALVSAQSNFLAVSALSTCHSGGSFSTVAGCLASASSN
jgi:hypothetical protein